jgi:hypothetical protein
MKKKKIKPLHLLQKTALTKEKPSTPSPFQFETTIKQTSCQNLLLRS